MRVLCILCTNGCQGRSENSPAWRSELGPDLGVPSTVWRENNMVLTLGQLQAGRHSGMARSRAKARLNWVSQGQRWGRCRVGGVPSG